MELAAQQVPLDVLPNSEVLKVSILSQLQIYGCYDAGVADTSLGGSARLQHCSLSLLQPSNPRGCVCPHASKHLVRWRS